MKKRRFGGKPSLKEDMVLQITSMADIFTILLVFLLKTFSTGISSITPSNALELPSASAQDQVEETLKVEISAEAILLDDKPVTTLHSFKFDSNDLERDGSPRSLNAAFVEKVKKQRKPSSEESPTLLVLADRKAPFSTVRTVLDAASAAGVGDFKLIVAKEE